MSPSPHDVTRLLEDVNRGNRTALDTLIPLVHDELHRLARGYLARERPGHTLQPTALVNEAYLRLIGERADWKNRAHFIGVAAQLMRFILVDHCRHKHYQKRGGGAARVTFDENLQLAAECDGEELLALDDALKKLAAQDARKSQIAELRYFGGLSVEETAEALSISVATVMRDWRLTKAWLQKELS
jgi:RNA polymerase sigma factor (TIGR02999 family)